MNQTSKLTQFLTKLAEGRYQSIAYARSALGGTVGLNDSEKEGARAAIAAYFNPKRKEPAPPPPPAESAKTANGGDDEVASIFQSYAVNVSGRTHLVKRVAKAAGEEKIYSEGDLTVLLRVALEVGAVGAFDTLVRTHQRQLTPNTIDFELLRRSPHFFVYMGGLFAVTLNSETARATTLLLISELERRHGDDKQIDAFERFVSEVVCKNKGMLAPMTRLVIKHATPRFVLDWLFQYDDIADHASCVQSFTRRMLSLYMNDETDAGSLCTLVGMLEPSRLVVEEIVRVLLTRRQLGDALTIAGLAPEGFKPQLHKILHSVVRDHGDPLALVTFGTIFQGLVDRDEIKVLVRRFLKPDVNERIDALLDGIEPVDVFESAPSMLPSKEQAQIRDTLRHNLGLPVQQELPDKPLPFLQDLLAAATQRAKRA